MTLAAPTECQANNVLIDKRKYQFSWSIVVWQATRNRQIFKFAAVGNFLVEKKLLPRPAQQFIGKEAVFQAKCANSLVTSVVKRTEFANFVISISTLIIGSISPHSYKLKDQENVEDLSMVIPHHRLFYGQLHISWQAMQRGTEHKWHGSTRFHLQKIPR